MLMPVSGASGLRVGDFANANLATYVDPYMELDAQRAIALQPRWLQGLLVKIDAVESVNDRPISSPYRPNNIYPADRVFAGVATNHGANAPVIGVMHPRRAGWLSFHPGAFGGERLNSIPDLKARIGQISVAKAAEHNRTWHEHGRYTLPNGAVLS
jgi:hypothetical protein